MKRVCPTMRHYRWAEVEAEPWIERLIQNYDQSQREISVRAHVVGVSDLNDSVRTDESDACMLFLSDGNVFIPAVLSAAAWERLQELEERESFSGLHNTTVSVRKFQLNFHMDPELTSCQFYLTIDQIISVGRVNRHYHPPSCTTLPSVKQQILKSWRSQMKCSVSSANSQSGFPLSCLMGAWHNDIILNMLNNAMEKITTPTGCYPSVATPTHWHTERLSCRGEECFIAPVSHLLIPEEQRELLTADPGASSGSETPSVLVPPYKDIPANQPVSAQYLERDSPTTVTDRLADLEQPTLDHPRPEAWCGRAGECGEVVSPWDMFCPASDLLGTPSSSSETSIEPLSQRDSESLLAVVRQGPMATSSQVQSSIPSREEKSGSNITPYQRPHPSLHSSSLLSEKTIPDQTDDQQGLSPPTWVTKNTALSTQEISEDPPAKRSPTVPPLARKDWSLLLHTAKMSAKRQSKYKNTVKCNKKNKRGESAIINPDIEDTVIRNGMRDAWMKKTSYSHGSVELDCEPFPHCRISNFIQNQSFVQSLQDELLQLNFNSKSNDLYKFQQSDDLRRGKEHHISEIRSLIFVQFRLWLAEVLGVDLEPTVDISCAKYEHTDVLLCHDDELEGRRVAFILYLVPPWDPSNGGTLDLYSTDEHYQPVTVVKSLLPCWNTLMFFEVSPVSFHQVAEVLTEGKCRLSLSGWFHGPSLLRPPRYIEPPIPRHTHTLRDESVLFEWVNETYMNPLYQAQVQQEFEDNSEIRLPNFLKEEKFKEVSEALRLPEVEWEKRGPPNKSNPNGKVDSSKLFHVCLFVSLSNRRRCYACAELHSLPACLKECWDLFSSEPFFLLLSNLTGLSLHYLAVGHEENGSDNQGNESDAEKGEKEKNPEEQGTSSATSSNEKNEKGPPVCFGELRRWSHGNYTLLHDSVKREFALDLLLYLGCTDWKAEFGGFTSYIAHDEDEELLTVYPEDNSLALVYRDKETLRFVKHINHSSTDQRDAEFHDFSFTYYE
ncbi:hypothetical protein NFI96_023671 [Prochilodus magdalenae]|nr:hypothetical protein NFI96_023671 [Prochilodus magdalenae]